METGGWRRVPYLRRRCPLCQVLEDEEHFMFECDLYNHLRQRFIPEQSYIEGGEIHLRDLLNSSDERTLNKVGLYIQKSFTTRDKFLANG